MQSIRPDGRLSLCGHFVRAGSRLADIGTDHGYLPIVLVQSGVIGTALACDINPSPLRSARDNIERCGLSDKIEVRLSDGLRAVSADEADDIVIAGMGGELIVRIVSECRWLRDPKKRLILQPMTRYDVLLRWLYENGFAPKEQRAVCDSEKYYTVICAHFTGTAAPCSRLRSYLGALDPSDENSRAFLQKTVERLRRQQNGDPTLGDIIQQLEVML